MTLELAKNELSILKNKLSTHENSLVNSEEMSIKYEISKNITRKLEQIIEELDVSKDLHKYMSTLRYALETLIITELLVNEKLYFVKMYYAVYIQQENRITQMIIRIKHEIDFLKKYTQEYNLEVKKLEVDALLMNKDEEIFQAYKKIVLDNNISSFFSEKELEDYGFEGLVLHLEKTVLPKYIEQLKKCELRTLNKAKQLVKEKWFKDYFGNRVQHTQVFKLLGDDRSWAKKAEYTHLIHEYNLNYDMTSSLLHFTSYSLFTPNEANENEISYNNKIINQYINQIVKNLGAFSKVMMYDIFNIVIKV